MNDIEALLRCAARSVTAAARACREWEDPGDGDSVADTAWEASEATSDALGGMNARNEGTKRTSE